MSIEAMNWALSVPVGGNMKLCLIGLANHAHPDGSESYPSLETLAKYCHCDRSTAKRNVHKLVEEGWAAEDGFGPRGTVKYRIPVGAAVPLEGGQFARGGNLPPGASVPPEPSIVSNGYKDSRTAQELLFSATGPDAYAPTHEGAREGQQSQGLCAWELPPTEYQWHPTYISIAEHLLSGALKYGAVWRDPDPVRQVMDFWRDLSWHFDTADTAEKVKAVKVALKAYPLDRSLMVLRAIVGGLKDPWRRERGMDNIADLVAIVSTGTKAKDNVDRYGTSVSDEEVWDAILAADDNRRYTAYLRDGQFGEVDEAWRSKHRKRLERQMRGPFNRYMTWKTEAERSGVR